MLTSRPRGHPGPLFPFAPPLQCAWQSTSRLQDGDCDCHDGVLAVSVCVVFCLCRMSDPSLLVSLSLFSLAECLTHVATATGGQHVVPQKRPHTSKPHTAAKTMQTDGQGDSESSADASQSPVNLSLSIASSAAAPISVMHATEVAGAAAAAVSGNGFLPAATSSVAASPSASTGRFSVHVASNSPTPIDSRRDSPQRAGQRSQAEVDAEAASNRVLEEAEGSRLDGQSEVAADAVSPASANGSSLAASQLIDAQSMASLASTQQSIAAEVSSRRSSPPSSKRGSTRGSPKGSATASAQPTPSAAASASRAQQPRCSVCQRADHSQLMICNAVGSLMHASCVTVPPTPASSIVEVPPALPNHLFVPEPAPLVEPDALAIAILQKELADLRMQAAADRKELDSLRNANTATVSDTLLRALELPPPVQLKPAAPLEPVEQYAMQEQPAEDDEQEQESIDSTLRASPPASTAAVTPHPRSPFAAYPLAPSQPFYPLSAPLSTVPEVSVVATAPALYPAGALANFSGPRLLDGALPGLASGVAPPHAFAVEYPLRSASAHVTSKLLPDFDRPVFARGADSAGFKPPPAWGSVEHRPLANGDDGDNSSRYLLVHGGAVSSDVWTAAHTKPTRDELLWEREVVDPLCTPLHARERMGQCVNASLPQPPGRDW